MESPPTSAHTSPHTVPIRKLRQHSAPQLGELFPGLDRPIRGKEEEDSSLGDANSVKTVASEIDLELETPKASKLTALHDFRHRMQTILDSKGMLVMMIVVTLYVLFGDDVRLAACPKSADAGFQVASNIAFAWFILDSVLSCLFRTRVAWVWAPRVPVVHGYPRITGYVFSFMFWLDVATILSLLPDLDWVWDAVTDSNPDFTLPTGTRWSRIFRLVRLVRLVKLYYQVQHYSKRLHRTMLGAQLSLWTSQRIASLVLASLVILSVLSITDVQRVEETSLYLVHQSNQAQDDAAEYTWQLVTRGYISEFDFWDDGTRRLVYFSALHNGVAQVFLDLPDVYSQLRHNQDDIELKFLEYQSTLASGQVVRTTAWFNEQPVVADAARGSIYVTLLVGGLFILAALLFTQRSSQLLLRPVERMVEIVQNMAQDPNKIPEGSDEQAANYETAMLENAIRKIGGLLRVGFGSEGATIIASSLSDHEFKADRRGDMVHAVIGFASISDFDQLLSFLDADILVYVNKISRIVHNCALSWGGAPMKNLGEAYMLVWTLKEEDIAMLDEQEDGSFPSIRRGLLAAGTGGGSIRKVSIPHHGSGPRLVNRAARASSIVEHRTARTMSAAAQAAGPGGAPGGAPAPPVDPNKVVGAAAVADQALIAFLKMIAEVNRSLDLLDAPEINVVRQKKPAFYARLAFGLHCGWAVKGAIGSIHKIDATFLSPHVNLAARLCASARSYGLSMLLSGPFHDLLSSAAQQCCRKVDIVTVKYHKLPLELYTYDVWEWRNTEPRKLLSFDNFVDLCADPDVFTSQVITTEKDRKISVLGAAPIIEHPVQTESYTPLLWEADADLKTLRAPFSSSFRKRYKQALDAFLNGNWADARLLLQELVEDASCPVKSGDGPSRCLLSYMARCGHTPPPGWNGAHPLGRG